MTVSAQADQIVSVKPSVIVFSDWNDVMDLDVGGTDLMIMLPTVLTYILIPCPYAQARILPALGMTEPGFGGIFLIAPYWLPSTVKAPRMYPSAIGACFQHRKLLDKRVPGCNGFMHPGFINGR